MANALSDEISEPNHPTVFDLPHLHKRPSFNTLQPTLSSLALAPASWDLEEDNATFDETGLPAYLTRIIASPLHWLPTASAREEIWELASKRLSERSGRSGMSSFERVFKVPTLRPKNGCSQKEGENGTERKRDDGSVEIKIHEPALMGDQLGNKTWLGAYVLAKKLPELLPRYFPQASVKRNEAQKDRIRLLELGAGTGLAGIAAAAMYPTTTSMHLTDLPEIVPNLQVNIELNKALLEAENVTVGVLDWGHLPKATVIEEERFNLILAADSLYGPEHPAWLTNTIAMFSKRDCGKVFTVLPYRAMDRDYHEELWDQMRQRGFEILEEGEAVGVEDWHNWEGREEVRCWWCVWGWVNYAKETEIGEKMASVMISQDDLMDADVIMRDEDFVLKALAKRLALAFPETLDVIL